LKQRLTMVERLNTFVRCSLFHEATTLVRNSIGILFLPLLIGRIPALAHDFSW
jgi:hypothetical protein